MVRPRWLRARVPAASSSLPSASLPSASFLSASFLSASFLSISLAVSFAFVSLLAVSPDAAAQAAKKEEFVPHVGQAGKDVIWVPTPDELVERMLRMAQATSKDFVIDLGSGDGRIAIAAAKKIGARAMGIEYNPDMVELSTRKAREE